MEKQYVMRTLCFNDVFKMTKILKKLGIKDKISGIIREIKVDGKNELEVGKELVMNTVFAATEELHLAQADVNDFLGSLVGISGKEFGALDLDISFDVIAQFKEQKGIISFFKSATK